MSFQRFFKERKGSHLKCITVDAKDGGFKNFPWHKNMMQQIEIHLIHPVYLVVPYTHSITSGQSDRLIRSVDKITVFPFSRARSGPHPDIKES